MCIHVLSAEDQTICDCSYDHDSHCKCMVSNTQPFDPCDLSHPLRVVALLIILLIINTFRVVELLIILLIISTFRVVELLIILLIINTFRVVALLIILLTINTFRVVALLIILLIINTFRVVALLIILLIINTFRVVELLIILLIINTFRVVALLIILLIINTFRVVALLMSSIPYMFKDTYKYQPLALLYVYSLEFLKVGTPSYILGYFFLLILPFFLPGLGIVISRLIIATFSY